MAQSGVVSALVVSIDVVTMKDHNLSVSEVESIEICDIQQQKTERSDSVDVTVEPARKIATTDRLAKLLSSTGSLPKVNISFEDVTYTVTTGINLDWSCKRGR